jgi:hypothetical protein
MKFLALEKEVAGVSEEQFTPVVLQQESARAWELYQEGTLREMYFRTDRQEAVLVLECASLKHARSALHSLPLVKNGLIDFEVFPLRPYDGFARLFSSRKQQEK